MLPSHCYISTITHSSSWTLFDPLHNLNKVRMPKTSMGFIRIHTARWTGVYPDVFSYRVICTKQFLPNVSDVSIATSEGAALVPEASIRPRFTTEAKFFPHTDKPPQGKNSYFSLHDPLIWFTVTWHGNTLCTSRTLRRGIRAWGFPT